jgi:phosphatidylserine decarboxylase
MQYKDRLKLFIQYLLPKHFISICAGKLAEITTPWIKNYLIERFIAVYNVDMSLAIESKTTHYHHFNDFFTRAIRLENRPIDSTPKALCSPVDGAVSQFGNIQQGRIIQAKQHDYSVSELLTEPETARLFESGEFCTIYLAPKDYHRIHIPVDGELLSMIHVPGTLFSVNPLTAQHVPRLFARNERVVTLFNTALGKMAMVFVGATIVGSIETQWAGVVTPPSKKQITRTSYRSKNITYKKGDEIARFKLGSTVILLIEKNHWLWDEKIKLKKPLILGENLLVQK